MPAQPPSAPFIMLAEDNSADVFLIERALQKHFDEFEFRTFGDGELAIGFIDSLDETDESRCPDIVIADLNLPRRNGLEILKCVRKSRRCALVPVLVLTSSDSPTDVAATTRLGATRYFCKPLNLNEFMEIGAAVRETLAGAAA